MKNRPPKNATEADRALRLARADPQITDSGIEFVSAGSGQATVRLQVAQRHLNFMNTCHGGVIFTLADSAFGLASNSYGQVAAGIDAHITFQVAAVAGDTLTATARELSRSSKLAVYRVDVTREDGVLVSAFTGTVYVTSRHHADAGK